MSSSALHQAGDKHSNSSNREDVRMMVGRHIGRDGGGRPARWAWPSDDFLDHLAKYRGGTLRPALVLESELTMIQTELVQQSGL